ncbi:MAG TPA: cyclic nucleotide-binding domain-containing protein [Tepidisphaeraceae bacterium]|nr:cyclic nucleotide-binding domain-containing protein [Tepidisphaeraceae bacterium]
MGDEVLTKIPLFAGLTDHERVELGALLRTKQFESNAPVFWIGENGTEFYIVQQGSVTISAPDETGKEVTLAKLGPGHFFGEISLLDGGPRTATVRTTNDTTLLCLSRDEFHKFLLKHPAAAIHMLTILGQRQRDTNEKLRGVRNANDAIEESLTTWGRISMKIASLSATQSFMFAHVILITGWIIANAIAGQRAVDPWPYDTAAFVLGVEALFLSLFILVAANQEGNRERIRSDLDYQVNLKAQYEVMQLHRKMDRLQAMLEEDVAAREAGEPAATGATA